MYVVLDFVAVAEPASFFCRRPGWRVKKNVLRLKNLYLLEIFSSPLPR